jgi:hypothetical protein
MATKWAVLSKETGAHLVQCHVPLPGGNLTPEYFRRAGGANFRRRPSRFRSVEAAQRIADLLNEEVALRQRIENDAHTDEDLARFDVVRAAIAKATS